MSAPPPPVAQAKHLSIYIPSLRGGGAERVMVTLANGFAARGHRVDLILLKVEGPYVADVSEAVRIIDLKATGVLRGIPALARYLRRERPDSLLTAMSHVNISAILARMLSRTSTRLVISERCSLNATGEHQKEIAQRAVLAMMKILYPKADAITVVADAIKSELLETINLNGDIIFSILNPISKSISEISKIDNQPHDWFKHKINPVILGAGRLSKQKDFSTLIKAFDILKKSHDIRLMIIGEGPERPSLERLISELGHDGDIALPGFVDNPYAFMKASTLFVLSSLYEGSPGTLIQAMACGTPVVSTDCPTGPREILEDGRWGTLVPVGDATALADAISQALRAKQHPAVLQRAAAFNEDAAVTRYLEVMCPAPTKA